jgi:hypothetical protein
VIHHAGIHDELEPYSAEDSAPVEEPGAVTGVIDSFLAVRQIV